MTAHGATDMRLLRRLNKASIEEIQKVRLEIEADPINRNAPGSFWLFTPKARAKLDACARAITQRLAERKQG